MFARILATVAAAAVLSTAIISPSFADMGGGSGEPEATAYYQGGSSINSRRNRDGSRTVTEADRNGAVVNQRVVAKPAKPAKKPRKPGRAWASAYDPATGTRVTSIDNGDRTRTVISIGPFGIGIGISR